LDAFEIRDGYRYQAFTTITAPGSSPSWRPDTGRTPASRTGSAAAGTGLGHLPSRQQNINRHPSAVRCSRATPPTTD